MRVYERKRTYLCIKVITVNHNTSKKSEEKGMKQRKREVACIPIDDDVVVVGWRGEGWNENKRQRGP